ncbi:type II toxin-antitoxin system HicB family antitoxin [Campylobacter jejuni]|uniref:type II toxin-antitoxin system HicB family antitoxin n=1 Tax=Campylobacter TaxID=194 RepID=UPI00106804D9|nr:MULTISPECIES: type II toxin-antitoxin system HicB family antitoxin [Campylobacter]EAK4165284.1 type II toxin-antitoxin system HicB family antitoxin [Campylobacter coli]TEY38795.1 type II toxin-antitoxin system HicB family antitoxin [Campylobacter sp. CH185]EAJ1453072.1 type II toxin-antitoxin system HicB family antitoxin [Campylobacter jejuni]EAK5214981.1 type II toxin-antitoxin system HicB family antitoxin [Campylobacter jejuni]EDO8215505.1 type II toxin-antitoxin system HicB family antito
MKDLDYYLNLPYEIIIKKLDEKDGGGYFARYKDFPYIIGDGENEIEALKDLKEAFKGALEVMLEKGDYIKEPIDNEAKIRINITLPKSLVEAIDTISDNRSKFLADLANSAIKSYKIST